MVNLEERELNWEFLHCSLFWLQLPLTIWFPAAPPALLAILITNRSNAVVCTNCPSSIALALFGWLMKCADFNRYTFSSMFSNEKVYLLKSAHFTYMFCTHNHWIKWPYLGEIFSYGKSHSRVESLKQQKTTSLHIYALIMFSEML